MMIYIRLQKNLNVDKAHGWDQLSIKMIKTCSDSFSFPLKSILKSMINDSQCSSNS